MNPPIPFDSLSSRCRALMVIPAMFCLSLLTHPVSGAEEILEFDTDQTLKNSFLLVGPKPAGWLAKEGADGTGALIAPAEGYTAYAYSASPVNLKAAESVTFSMDFHYTRQVQRINEDNMGLFVISSDCSLLEEAPPGASLSFQMSNVDAPPTTTNTELVFIQNPKTEHAVRTQLAKGPWWDSAALVDHWIRMEVTLSKRTTSGSWDATVRVLDLGLDGQDQRVLFEETVSDFSAEKLYEAPSLLVGFMNLRNERGFRFMDRFRVVLAD